MYLRRLRRYYENATDCGEAGQKLFTCLWKSYRSRSFNAIVVSYFAENNKIALDVVFMKANYITK